MSKKITRYLSVILAVSILFSGVSLQITTAYAAEADSTVVTDTEPIVSTDSELIDYTQYTTAHGITNKATANIELPVATYAADGADVTVEENVLNWNKGDGTVTWTFDVAQTAVYNLKILWESVQSGINPEFAVLIDGKCPFDEAENIRLSRLWKNADEKPRQDVQGNEYAQEQVEIGGVITTTIYDSEGANVGPFEFALTEGTHTFTISDPEQSIKIHKILFTAPEQIDSYKDVSASYDVKDLDADVIPIEGENADVKSSNSIISKSNNSDAGMSPSQRACTNNIILGSIFVKIF